MRPHPVEQSSHGLGRHQRRGAATEKHGAYLASGGELGLVLEIAHEGPRPARRIDTVADVTVEVAVGAFRPAERPVNINCNGLGNSSLTHPAPHPNLPPLAGEGRGGGWVPPLPRCGRGAFKGLVMWPLSRTAGEGAERSEAGEGLHLSAHGNSARRAWRRRGRGGWYRASRPGPFHRKSRV